MSKCIQKCSALYKICKGKRVLCSRHYQKRDGQGKLREEWRENARGVVQFRSLFNVKGCAGIYTSPHMQFKHWHDKDGRLSRTWELYKKQAKVTTYSYTKDGKQDKVLTRDERGRTLSYKWFEYYNRKNRSLVIEHREESATIKNGRIKTTLYEQISIYNQAGHLFKRRESMNGRLYWQQQCWYNGKGLQCRIKNWTSPKGLSILFGAPYQHEGERQVFKYNSQNKLVLKMVYRENLLSSQERTTYDSLGRVVMQETWSPKHGWRTEFSRIFNDRDGTYRAKYYCDGKLDAELEHVDE